MFAGFSKFEIMLFEMFSKIFFRNHIYWDVFENLTFQNLPAIGSFLNGTCHQCCQYRYDLLLIGFYTAMIALELTNLYICTYKYSYMVASYR